ncbi:hypothetical protein ACFX15_034660 [Malus domestica]
MRTSASSPTLTDLRSHLRASSVTARWSELMAVSRAESSSFRGWDEGGGGGGIVLGDGDGEKRRELLLLVMESLHRYLAADAASALEASLILSLN